MGWTFADADADGPVDAAADADPRTRTCGPADGGPRVDVAVAEDVVAAADAGRGRGCGRRLAPIATASRHDRSALDFTCVQYADAYLGETT